MNEFRIERDSMGEMQVPVNALYGASTARAVQNFPISQQRFSRAFIRALGWVKYACAMANGDLGILSQDIAKAISHASDIVARGDVDDQFVVDIFQTGSGTSTNMNANEVIAHLAVGPAKTSMMIHPNDHVNRGQSSNDVIPSAGHIAIKFEIDTALLPALKSLGAALESKSKEFAQILKSGRTHLQDAVPITLGQEFAGYAAQVHDQVGLVHAASLALCSLALGGTAVGTGVNTHPLFARKAIEVISQKSGLAFHEAHDHVAAQAYPGALVMASSALRGVALSLMKIANDIRWLASGPVAGIGELRLPAVQPGSSIMPGKINPVIAESLLMVCAAVIGNDAAIATGAQWSNFELHTMWPLLIDRILESIRILTSGVQNFTEKLVQGITVNQERCQEHLLYNPAVATVLAPMLGYDRIAAWVHEAVERGGQVIFTDDALQGNFKIGDQTIPAKWLIGPHR